MLSNRNGNVGVIYTAISKANISRTLHCYNINIGTTIASVNLSTRWPEKCTMQVYSAVTCSSVLVVLLFLKLRLLPFRGILIIKYVSLNMCKVYGQSGIEFCIVSKALPCAVVQFFIGPP